MCNMHAILFVEKICSTKYDIHELIMTQPYLKYLKLTFLLSFFFTFRLTSKLPTFLRHTV